MKNGILEVGDRVKSTRLAPAGTIGQLGTVFYVHAQQASVKTDSGITFTVCAKDSEWVTYVASGIKSINIDEII